MLIQVNREAWLDAAAVKRIYVSHVNILEEPDRAAFDVHFECDIGDYHSDLFDTREEAEEFAQHCTDLIDKEVAT